MTPRPRAVVLDLDGTLIDSAPSLHRAAAETMRRLGHRAPSPDEVRGFVGDGVPKLVARCLAAAGRPPSDEAVALFREIYDADPLTGTVPLPGARALLAGLDAAGIALALCTNKPMAPTRTILDGLGLGPFGAVIAGDSLPERKPDPAPLLAAIEKLRVEVDEAVYVGDSGVDARTAAAAGVRYLHVAGGYGSEAPPNVSRCDGLSTVLGILTQK